MVDNNNRKLATEIIEDLGSLHKDFFYMQTEGTGPSSLVELFERFKRFQQILLKLLTHLENWDGKLIQKIQEICMITFFTCFMAWSLVNFGKIGLRDFFFFKNVLIDGITMQKKNILPRRKLKNEYLVMGIFGLSLVLITGFFTLRISFAFYFWFRLYFDSEYVPGLSSWNFGTSKIGCFATNWIANPIKKHFLKNLIPSLRNFDVSLNEEGMSLVSSWVNIREIFLQILCQITFISIKSYYADIMYTHKIYPAMYTNPVINERITQLYPNQNFRQHISHLSNHHLNNKGGYIINNNSSLKNYFPVLQETKPVPVLQETKPVPVLQETKPVLVLQETKPVLVLQETKPVPVLQETKPVPVLQENKKLRINFEKKIRNKNYSLKVPLIRFFNK
jgi:hypothetical protein